MRLTHRAAVVFALQDESMAEEAQAQTPAAVTEPKEIKQV
jgi:hypothetical protein